MPFITTKFGSAVCQNREYYTAASKVISGKGGERRGDEKEESILTLKVMVFTRERDIVSIG